VLFGFFRECLVYFLRSYSIWQPIEEFKL